MRRRRISVQWRIRAGFELAGDGFVGIDTRIGARTRTRTFTCACTLAWTYTGTSASPLFMDEDCQRG